MLFTADRGLAGSYNNALIKGAEDMMRSDPQTKWELVIIGKRGYEYFRKRQWPIVEKVLGLGGAASLEEAQRISDFLVDRYEKGETDEVLMYYQAFVSSVLSRPKLARYLSLTPEALGSGRRGRGAQGQGLPDVDYILEPSQEAVFDALLPRFLTSRIYITMAEAAASEHSARMIAMNNATKNCEEMGSQPDAQDEQRASGVDHQGTA